MKKEIKINKKGRDLISNDVEVWEKEIRAEKTIEFVGQDKYRQKSIYWTQLFLIECLVWSKWLSTKEHYLWQVSWHQARWNQSLLAVHLSAVRFQINKPISAEVSVGKWEGGEMESGIAMPDLL